MKKSWTLGLEEGIAKEISGDFKSAHLVRKRLIKMLEDKYSEAELASLSNDNYRLATWAYKEADLKGFKRAIRLVQSLLDETEKE